MDYQKFKQRLLEQKQQLEHELEINNNFGFNEPFASSEASGELSQYDNHPADSGSQLYEREKDFILRKFQREELEDVNAALEKIENGTYGICEKTGKQIPLERLEALPTARTGIMESPNQDQNDDTKPIEEITLRGMEEDYATNSDETEYNEQNAWQIVAQYNELDMTYEGSSIIDNKDGIGYVELVEAIGATDMYGYRGDDSVNFLRNIQYDKWMNDMDYDEEDNEEDDDLIY